MLAALTLIAAGALATLSNAEAGEAPARSTGNHCSSQHNPEGFRFWIHVTKWCIVPGVRHQEQLKVQMRIHNQSERSLDIEQSRVRVILRHFDQDRWSPPVIGQPTVDRPIRTSYLGEPVWAVPAQADGSYDVFPHKLEPTHATHWPVSELGPKGTLNPHFHYGDLVYDIPVPQPKPRGWSAIDDVVGIAFIKGRDIIALCPPETWGPHRPAGTF